MILEPKNTRQRHCNWLSISSSAGLVTVLILAVTAILEAQYSHNLSSGNFTAMMFATW